MRVTGLSPDASATYPSSLARPRVSGAVHNALSEPVDSKAHD